MSSLFRKAGITFGRASDDVARVGASKVDDAARIGASKVDDAVRVGASKADDVAKAGTNRLNARTALTYGAGGLLGLNFLTNFAKTGDVNEAVNNTASGLGSTVGGAVGSTGSSVVKGVFGLPQDSSILGDYGSYISSGSFSLVLVSFILSFMIFMLKLL